MPAVPSTIALETPPDGASITAALHRDNYTDIQAAVNAIIAILDGGANGDFLKNLGGGIVDWAAVTAGSVPSGVVSPYAGSSAPGGWLLCDGSAVSRTTYADLFAVVSTTYGVGDGSTTFNLPDLRGRVAVGKGSNAAVDTLGENDGVTEANRRPQHRHTAHAHTSAVQFDSSGASGASPRAFTGGSLGTSSVDGGSGTATDALDAPAYLVLNYIVKT